VDGATSPRSLRSGGIRLGIALGVGVLIWHLPAPQGVTADAWHLLAIFVATIVGIVLVPPPMGAVALLPGCRLSWGSA
jgi:DASS family divalent anion:Na+ symporter